MAHDVWVVEAQRQAGLFPAVFCKDTADWKQLDSNAVPGIFACRQNMQDTIAPMLATDCLQSNMCRHVLLRQLGNVLSPQGNGFCFPNQQPRNNS
jgi:hypothetical protein